jgi:opacity protein-like surface antigen
MKKLLVGTVTVAALSLAGAAHAADMPVKAPPPPPAPVCSNNDIVRSDNQVSLDFIDTHINYGPEFLTGVGTPLDTEKGWVPGLSVTGSLMRDVGSLCHLYLMGRFSWVDGHTNYWASGGPVTSNVDGARVDSWDFRLGKGFDIGPNMMLTPYVGAGTRWWNRLLNGPFGYDEVYKHGYAGGGLLFQVSPISKLVLSADGLVGSTFDASMTASLVPGGTTIAGLASTYPLGQKAIYMAGGSADWAFTTLLHGNVGIEYTHFAYGQSPANAAGFLEPNSRTSTVTVSAGLGLAF